MRVKNRFTSVAAAIAVIISIFSLFAGGGAQFASAAASAYTNVMTDLTQDESFNAAGYPENVRDYSINVIQIAESTDGELFIYTYQPSGQQVDLIASSINISRQDNQSFKKSYTNYQLTFINSNGVFYKYKVEHFGIDKTEVRYYDVSNILRPFDKKIDTPPAVGEITEVANAVGQLWTVRTVGDTVDYARTDSDVVTITKKYVGYFDYVDGKTISGAPGIYGEISARHTIRNFVAFSTDRPIDRLIEAELQYSLADCSFEYCANPFHTGSSEDDPHAFKDYVSRTQGESVQQDPVVVTAGRDENCLHGWFGHKYTWDKIQSTEDFLKDSDNQGYTLTNAAGISSIEGTQWVLNFYKAEREVHGNSNLADNHIHSDYQRVTDVIILRLMFETDGETYNLGVVDNKMTGDDKPINSNNPYGGGWGSGCTAGIGTGCNGCNWSSALPWWAWLLIAVASSVLLIVMLKMGMWLVKIIFGKDDGSAEVKKVKLEQKHQRQLLKYQAKLARRQRKRDERAAKKAQKAKDKQAAKKRAKAKNKRKGGNKAQSANKSAKGKGKKK